jgi:hypothetical protein
MTRRQLIAADWAQFHLSGDITSCPHLQHVFRRRMFRFAKYLGMHTDIPIQSYVTNKLHLPRTKANMQFVQATWQDIKRRYRPIERLTLTEREKDFVFRRLSYAFGLLAPGRTKHPRLFLSLNSHLWSSISYYSNGSLCIVPGYRSLKPVQNKWFFYGDMLVTDLAQIRKNQYVMGLLTATGHHAKYILDERPETVFSEYPQFGPQMRRRKVKGWDYSW